MGCSSSATTKAPTAAPACGTGGPRKACKFGLRCWRKSLAHTSQFSHPGDSDYRLGQAIFVDGAEPEFETLRQLFDFCDLNGHGTFMSSHDLQQALELMRRYRSGAPLNAAQAWRELAGDSEEVGFVKFAFWAQAVGVELPIGVESFDIPLDSASNHLSCGFVYSDGTRCECKNFTYAHTCRLQRGSDAGSAVRFCKCGHKRSAHAWRSEAGTRWISSQVATPFYWPRDSRSAESQGLIKLGPEGVAQFQKLLDKTHKKTDNWTRDRGCSLHGLHCPPGSFNCAFDHKCPVPQGYKVVSVMRNMNRDLWGLYAVTRGAICKECEGTERFAFRPVWDIWTVESLLEGAPAVERCNEWFLFHGTSPENCLNIARDNFKLALAGTGSTWKDPGSNRGTPLYGNGIYFAESVTKADEYSKAVDAGQPYAGCHALLVCRVVGGRTQRCDTSKIDPVSMQTQIISGPYHSVFGDRVSKMGKPYREMVIYDAAQCYPEYIVFYERIYAGSSKKTSRFKELLPVPRGKSVDSSDAARSAGESELQERQEQEVEFGARYKGQWRGAQKHGHGVLTRLDGQRYEGSFENGRAHGHGRCSFRNGSTYVGQWDRDMMHGHGKYSNTDGSAYEGEWVQDRQSGSGMQVWQDGARYEGEFMHGCKNGFGVYRSGSGICYEGQFLHDKMDGEGRYKFNDGRTHNGQWKQGHMNGFGKMQWPNGSCYEGNYDNDLRHGEGTYTWPDGRQYKGLWNKGKQHGVGAAIDAEGQRVEFEWSQGQRVATNV